MHIIRQDKIDPLNNIVIAYVSAGDPSSDGLAAGVGSICTVIGGALGGNVYRKDDVADDDWTLILDANP